MYFDFNSNEKNFLDKNGKTFQAHFIQSKSEICAKNAQHLQSTA